MEVFTQNSGMYNDVRNGKFNYQAFVDPNDPSQIYMEQPKNNNYQWSDRPALIFINLISHSKIVTIIVRKIAELSCSHTDTPLHTTSTSQGWPFHKNQAYMNFTSQQ